MRTPALCSKFGVDVNARSLVRVDDESKFETITGDPGDGQSPSCSIHDEYHEHGDDGQVDTMQTGMGARDQPLQVLITTAGDNLDGPCYARIQDERKKLQGIGKPGGGPPIDDETFFVEYTIDEARRLEVGSRAAQGQPEFRRLGRRRLPSRQATRRDRRAAQGRRVQDQAPQPVGRREGGLFRHRSLAPLPGIRTIPIKGCRRHAARAAARPPLHRRPRPCVEGRHRGARAAVPADRRESDARGSVHPDRILLRALGAVQLVPAYQGWDALGLLNVTEGDIIDYDEILEVLREIRGHFQLEMVAYDPHQATMMVTTMVKEGFPVVEYRPVVLNFSEPMKELDALTKARTIAHGGCPVMEWEMSNVVAAADKKDNVYPNKPREEAKIDNPVALISALGVAMKGEEEPMAASPWDDPDFKLVAA
jgi:phage terminase large subunit-like protein